MNRIAVQWICVNLLVIVEDDEAPKRTGPDDLQVVLARINGIMEGLEPTVPVCENVAALSINDKPGGL